MENTTVEPNTLYIEVSVSGLPEVDGLYIPSAAPPVTSEAGIVSTQGYWNGKMAWDRADGKAARSPAISYSIGFRCWRICRLDGHLAYEASGDDELPPTDRAWNVYKMGFAQTPTIVICTEDPRSAILSPHW